MIAPGTVVGERFEIERVVASGGMGTIHRAKDRRTERVVALKLLFEHDDGALVRFEREARSISELTHDAIVRYVEHGTSGGQPYLVMEWLEGEDLAARLARGALSEKEAITLVTRVADALGAAHLRGIIHRDVKPANVFLVGGRADAAKLVDFGVARDVARTHGPTKTGAAVGTVGYIAPELIRGAKADARADVFSLGCVLYECIAGRPAYEAAELVAILGRILFDEPLPLREIVPTVDRAIVDFVARALAKDPALRPNDGAAAAKLLRELTVERREPVPSSIRMTGAEQRFVSVLVIRASPNAIDETILARTADAHGCRSATLLDGSIVVVTAGSGVATDEAVRVLRCARALRPYLHDRRMAIATGRTTVTNRMPVGDAFERAVRLNAESLEHAVGRIRVDAVTSGLLATRFTVDAAGFVADDGATSERRLLGKVTPCVGRERELRVLGAIVEECFERPIASAVLITGAPGLGKSRLRHELVSARREVTVWSASGDLMSMGVPRAMLAELTRTAVAPQGLSEHVRVRLSASDAERVIAFLSELVGTPLEGDAVLPELRAARLDLPRLGREIDRAWLDLLGAELARGPVILVLDDLQWGDVLTCERIEAALRAFEDKALFVLALGRPEVHQTFSGLWREVGVQDIRLGELPRRACRDLVRAVLPDVDDATVNPIVERAAGNAFFLEELIRAVAEREERTSPATLPETVLAMLQARLDALDEGARRVLRAASIFGDVFWEGAIGHLQHDVDVGRAIDTLVDRELVSRRDRELVFRHALVREAAYATLTDDDRRAGHALAAEWLEQRGGAAVRVLAEHLERAASGDLDRLRAAGYWARAAQEVTSTVGISRPADAFACAQRGMKLLEDVPPCRPRDLIELGLELACSTAGALVHEHADRSVGHFDRALALAERVPDSPVLTRALTGMAMMAVMQSRPSHVIVALGERLRRLALAADDALLLLEAERILATNVLFRGGLAEALPGFERGRVLFERATNASPTVSGFPQVQVLGLAGICNLSLGKIDRGFELAREALDFARARDHVWSTAWAHFNLGLAHHICREYEEAIAAVDEALVISNANELVWVTTHAGILRAVARGRLEPSILAAERVEAAVARYEGLGLRAFLAWEKTFVAEAFELAGDRARARAVLADAVKIEASTGELASRPERFLVEARLLFEEGAREQAVECARAAVDVARRQASILFAIEGLRTLVEHGVSEAKAELEAALRQIEGREIPLVVRARAALSGGVSCTD